MVEQREHITTEGVECWCEPRHVHVAAAQPDDLADSEFRSWAFRAKADIDRLRFHLSGYKNEAERLRGVIDRAYYAIPAGDYDPSPAERVLIEFMAGDLSQAEALTTLSISTPETGEGS